MDNKVAFKTYLYRYYKNGILFLPDFISGSGSGVDAGSAAGSGLEAAVVGSEAAVVGSGAGSGSGAGEDAGSWSSLGSGNLGEGLGPGRRKVFIDIQKIY